MVKEYPDSARIRESDTEKKIYSRRLLARKGEKGKAGLCSVNSLQPSSYHALFTAAQVILISPPLKCLAGLSYFSHSLTMPSPSCPREGAWENG